MTEAAVAPAPAVENDAEPDGGAKAYSQAIALARRAKREHTSQPDEVAKLYEEAAGLADPGPDRAAALGQAAAAHLAAGRADRAITILLTAPDWPHHTVNGLRMLERAAIEAEACTPIHWLATRPTLRRAPSIDVIDRALRAALRRDAQGFADALLKLAGQLVPADDPLVPMLNALILDRRGDPEKAVEAYARAISLGSRDGRCHKRLFALLVAAGRSDEARAAAGRSLISDPPLDAQTREHLQRGLIGLQDSTPSEKRQALAALLPVYAHKGEVELERLGRLSVAATRALQAGSLMAALGTRGGVRCVFLRDVEEELAVDVEVPFAAQRIVLHPGGQHCMAIGDAPTDSGIPVLAMTINGPTQACALPARPHRILSRADGCVFAYRDGAIELRSWTGELMWESEIGKRGFAYWMAGSERQLYASYLDGIYEISPATGDVTGPMTIFEEPSEGVLGPAEAAVYESAWVQGIGFAGESCFALVRGGLYEVQPGPKVLLRERISPEQPVDSMITDGSGQLCALHGGGHLRLVGDDGRLSPAHPLPGGADGGAPLGDGRVAVRRGQTASIFGAAGETHRLEAASRIRSVQALGENTVCMVAGRDLLAATLS